jgi:type II secretory pathway predicted ATPase ExeA
MTKTIDTVFFIDPVIFIISIFIIFVIGISTLVIVYKVYKMHDVKNSDGEYAWMIPNNFIEFQQKMTDSQEKIVDTIRELSDNQHQVSRLLSNLVEATASLSQQIILNGMKKDADKK